MGVKTHPLVILERPNIYRDAMLKAYRLYGEIDDCFDDFNEDAPEIFRSVYNKERHAAFSTALMGLLESPSMRRDIMRL
ncbi:hypothetical protein LSM04_000260 [Trypanosoma melophagium]|uniref:uncharacterized protein n=1 Tax=Trypanosoma melophagium TaxID=715481 RepID=UPI003519DFCC|nr:hypothetical protein LSM04_000260 [Trypanosoma melophagium]